MSALNFITIRAPSYLTEPTLNDLISQADAETSTEHGSLRDKAIGLLVCHWIALSRRDTEGTGEAGSITSKREGQLSVTYAQLGAGAEDEELMSTRWGRELIGVRKKTIFPAFMGIYD